VFAQLVLVTGIALVAGAPAPQDQCLRALSSLTAGSVPQAANFVPVKCPPLRPAATFHYDRMQGSSRLSRSVAQDETVPLFPEFDLNLAQPGQKLRMIILLGAVRIERQVEALQTARPGQKLFVRSSDGQVLSARYEDRP
jgi:flagella basal body P-ring formation protein FlgA